MDPSSRPVVETRHCGSRDEARATQFLRTDADAVERVAAGEVMPLRNGHRNVNAAELASGNPDIALQCAGQRVLEGSAMQRCRRKLAV